MAAIHTCHAKGCDEAVPRNMFMCKRHWYMLPRPMRDAIWAAYRPGQELRMDPSAEYLAASSDAIKWLADNEGIGAD